MVSPLVGVDMAMQDYDLKPTAFHTDAHARYLADPLRFDPLPDQGIAARHTAVVGSHVCRFWSRSRLASKSDVEMLGPGSSVPFGTILPILGQRIVDSADAEHDGMFSFEDNWNWFYRTRFNGQEGIVYGADLFGLDDTPEENRIAARLYQTSGRYGSFYPVAGYQALSPTVVTRLEQEKLAIERVSKREYNLWSDQPDDMIALYKNHRDSYGDYPKRERTPLFVTTDLVAHAQHLIFDRLLQHLEEYWFEPRLVALLDRFIAALGTQDRASYPETLEKARLYFQVGRALLELAPERKKVEGTYGGSTVEYIDKDGEEVLSRYPEAVRGEIAKINAAEGLANSAVFSFSDGTVLREDYSQYKPRGHYTKNGVLEAYFRAMVWFGRIHFLIADSGEEPLPQENGQSSGSIALTLNMEPIALLCTELVKEDDGLYKTWTEIFDPITALIGLSDDLSFREVLPLWEAQGVKDFGVWAGSRENLLAFMKKAHEKLRPPAVSGSLVLYGPSEGQSHKPPMGWRLFGQRFTWDSWIHQQVSAPRIRSRACVAGLDVMKSFGSRTADGYLAATEYRRPEIPELEGVLDGLEKKFADTDSTFWNGTYYNQILYEIGSLARFEPGAGLYYTESPAWGRKSLLSAHGAWAELRHDTILYVKQNAAERAGGYEGPTFRTDPLPDPVHYLEPNVPFWQAATMATQNLFMTLKQFGLLDEETTSVMRRFQEILVKCVEIAESEASDRPLDPKTVAWIPTIPAELVPLIMIHQGQGEADEDALKMALVADVFTNGEEGFALETAVGIPYRIYVPLNDGQGGKRIAIGYSFSYYEFRQPIANRLTDEVWKEEAYKPGADLSRFEPSWMQGALLPPAPPSDGD